MQIVLRPNATEFMDRARPFLCADEARHNLTIGIGLTLQHPPPDLVLPERPFFATIERGDEVVATAIRQPPYGLVVSPAADVDDGRPWLPRLATLIRHEYPTLPNVQAPPTIAWGLAEEWRRLGGGPGTLKVALRIHALDEVRTVPAIPGELRRAGPPDRDLVLAWMQAMHDEALPFAPPVDANWIVATRLAEPGDPLCSLSLWVTAEGIPRSICGATRPTPRGVGINAVYTPPEHRRRGFATAAVAELSRRMVAIGRRCFLYTDLANPTSNRIYATIGYLPVCDVVDVGLGDGVVAIPATNSA